MERDLAADHRSASTDCSRGKATDSGRSYIFFSAAPDKNPSRRRRAGGDRSANNGNTEPNNCDKDNPTHFEAYKFECEVVAGAEAQIAKMSVCRFFVQGPYATACREPLPKAAIIKIHWTNVT